MQEEKEYSLVSGLTGELAFYMIPHFDVATFDFWKEVHAMDLLNSSRKDEIHERLQEIFWYNVLVMAGGLSNNGLTLSVTIINDELISMVILNNATQEELKFI